MYPNIADYTSEKQLDFERLRNEIVTDCSFVPSFGLHSDIRQQVEMLEREFAGQSRLKLVHAVLNMLVRRGVAVDIVYDHFCGLWAAHADFLLETLDSRWLVSACDTICDCSLDESEGQVAILVSLFVNTLKLTETERLITVPVEVDQSRVKGRMPLFDGLTAFMPGKGDMPINLLRRIDRAVRPETLSGKIGRELINRALLSDTPFARFSKMATFNKWRDYLSPVHHAPAPIPDPAQVPMKLDRPSYILLNDTGRLGGSFHIGTVYACTAIRESLANRGLHEIGWANDRERFNQLLAERLSKPTLVVLNGEGTLHHGSQRAAELLAICEDAKEQKIGVAVVNSVWEFNPDNMLSALKAADLIHVRDSISCDALPSEMHAEVTPDVSIKLFFRMARGGQFLPPQHEIGVMDSVVQTATDALLGFAEEGGFPFYAMPGGNLRTIRTAVAARSGSVWPRLLQLTDVMTAQSWVTGRFHGLIAALCAGRPVCALSSNTAKIEGFLRDAGLAEECLLGTDWISAPAEHKRNELVSRFEMQRTPAFIQRRDSYLEAAQIQIDKMFDAVARLANEKFKFSGPV
ncbi:hypothetical protein [Agrobacterium vitis]|uniref:hypothetical protein n=1 Tax=Agrobacterium vitis TaxID=373 RepID=UPI00157476B0|nr:hypothetical protein [Agrobacterium vitis]NSZ52727.1 polysaccharide pyruvyl transferase family protein [Agrobacterium vitis]NTA31485.1 polysaccharide pyruvyl transferase family protein [Agrobacterium vitis]